MGSFHLSLPVPDVERSAAFFTDVLGATIAHRDAAGYVNLELAGVQLTLTPGPPAPSDQLHFGLNLSRSELDAMAERIASTKLAEIVAQPRVVDEGTPLERVKMLLRCPAGYLIELKGYRR